MAKNSTDAAASKTLNYTLTEPNGTVDFIDVTVSLPATNSTGYGQGYAVTAISGTFEGTPIEEVGSGGAVQQGGDDTWDNTIFTSRAGGYSGSRLGIDDYGLEFSVDGQNVPFFSRQGSFEVRTLNGQYEDVTVVQSRTIVVSSDAVSSGLTIENDAVHVQSGGEVSGTIIQISGLVALTSGGESLGDTVYTGGVETVFAGAVAISATVSSGGLLQGAGSASEAVIYSGGQVSGIHVLSSLDVLSGGSANGISVSASAPESNQGIFIAQGGFADHTQVGSAGLLRVESGGTAYDTMVRASGEIDDYGLTSGTRVSGEDAFEYVFFGGTASGGDLAMGAQEIVLSGGTAVGTFIGSGGDQAVYGGLAIDCVVGAQGEQYVNTSATLSKIRNGGSEYVTSAGSLIDATFYSGSYLDYNSGADVSSAVLKPGANLFFDVQVDQVLIANHELQLVSGGNVLEEIGLRGSTSNISAVIDFSNGSTEVTITSKSSADVLTQAVAAFDVGSTGASTMSAHDLQSAYVGLAAEGAGGSAKHALG